MAINTDTLVLRDTANPPLTNKQAVLDIADFDNNFIKIYNDFLALSVTNSVDAYNAGTIYDDTIVQYATFSGRTYKWINGTPGSGVTPGTDPLKWLEVFPTELAHRKNSDIVLAEGTSDEVTAADIRAFIDAGLTTTTDLSITTHTGTSFLLNSSTGADVTLNEANATQAGLLGNMDWQQLQQTSGVNSGDQTLSSLGAEPAINKVTDFSVVNDDLFPSVQAVQTQITAFSNGKLDQNLTVDTVLDMGGQELDITNGTLKIGSAYTLAQTDGTVGQVLTTDGAGVTSWGTATGNGIFDASNDGGTVPTNFNVTLTDLLTFDGGDFVIESSGSTRMFDLDHSGNTIRINNSAVTARGTLDVKGSSAAAGARTAHFHNSSNLTIAKFEDNRRFGAGSGLAYNTTLNAECHIIGQGTVDTIIGENPSTNQDSIIRSLNGGNTKNAQVISENDTGDEISLISYGSAYPTVPAYQNNQGVRYTNDLLFTIGATLKATLDSTGVLDTLLGYSAAGLAGLTETLNFGGGGSGDVATLTITGGIITSRTLVP